MGKNRFKWGSIPNHELQECLSQYDQEDMAERVDRASFIQQEFGPATEMLLTGGMPAYLAINEMKLAYINCLDLSVIMCAHIFVEQTLGSGLILRGYDSIGEGGFAKIINKSIELEVIPKEIADRLHLLKEMRIAYFHPHVGLKKRSYMGRLIGRLPEDYREPFDLASDDAKEAIKIVVDLLRFQNPYWHPENVEQIIFTGF